jgi:hypothetical protein
LAFAVGGFALILPWLGAKTGVGLLADGTAILLLPGMIPGMAIGQLHGGGVHDVSWTGVEIASAAFYSGIAYFWMSRRDKRPSDP